PFEHHDVTFQRVRQRQAGDPGPAHDNLHVSSSTATATSRFRTVRASMFAPNPRCSSKPSIDATTTVAVSIGSGTPRSANHCPKPSATLLSWSRSSSSRVAARYASMNRVDIGSAPVYPSTDATMASTASTGDPTLSKKDSISARADPMSPTTAEFNNARSDEK